MKRQDMYNNSGCLDMTCYLALQKIEKEQRRQNSRSSRRNGKFSPSHCIPQKVHQTYMPFAVV